MIYFDSNPVRIWAAHLYNIEIIMSKKILNINIFLNLKASTMTLEFMGPSIWNLNLIIINNHRKIQQNKHKNKEVISKSKRVLSKPVHKWMYYRKYSYNISHFHKVLVICKRTNVCKNIHKYMIYVAVMIVLTRKL